MVDVDGSVIAMAGLIGMLGDLPQGVGDGVRIDRIRALEQLKASAAAAQARETAAFAVSQRRAQRAVVVPEAEVGRGIAAQIGLARRVSPNLACRYLGWATVLVSELPNTYARLCAGPARSKTNARTRRTHAAPSPPCTE